MSDVIARPVPVAGSLKLALGLLIGLAAVAAGTAALQGHFNIDALRGLIGPLMIERAHAPLRLALLYFAAYVAVTAACVPLEVPFALVAGAVFGMGEGVLIASFASIFGATLAFLGARSLLRGHVERHFADHLAMVNLGLERDGVFYLVNLRLLPILPFSLCNPLMGLTRMPVHIFFVVSQASMIFATLVFVNAGTQILAVHTLGDVLSPRLMGGLAALAVLPWLGKGLIRLVNMARAPVVDAGV